MPAEFVTSTLKDMGAAGAAISVLMTAVGALVGAVVIQYRQANKVYGYRLAERDTLNKALTENTAAIQVMTRAAEERNKATQELADAIDKLAGAFERVNDRLTMQHEVMKDLGKDTEKVVGSLADAVRVNTGMVTGIRDYIQKPPRSRR